MKTEFDGYHKNAIPTQHWYKRTMFSLEIQWNMIMQSFPSNENKIYCNLLKSKQNLDKLQQVVWKGHPFFLANHIQQNATLQIEGVKLNCFLRFSIIKIQPKFKKICQIYRHDSSMQPKTQTNDLKHFTFTFSLQPNLAKSSFESQFVLTTSQS